MDWTWLGGMSHGLGCCGSCPEKISPLGQREKRTDMRMDNFFIFASSGHLIILPETLPRLCFYQY
jgi:hypothetical protein